MMTKAKRLATVLLAVAFLVKDVTVVTADDNDDEGVIVTDVTSDVPNDTNVTNVTDTYQCIGPSKDDLDLYGILAWWMDGVVQVKDNFSTLLDNNYLFFLQVLMMIC